MEELRIILNKLCGGRIRNIEISDDSNELIIKAEYLSAPKFTQKKYKINERYGNKLTYSDLFEKLPGDNIEKMWLMDDYFPGIVELGVEGFVLKDITENKILSQHIPWMVSVGLLEEMKDE